MATRTEYRGLYVVEGATGQGGQDLTQNFKDIASWHPKSVWDKTNADANSGVPTPADDATQDFYPGSFWLNADTRCLYVCCDNTVSAAQWQRVGETQNTFTAGESLSAGDVCHLNGSGQMVKAAADSEANVKGLIAVAAQNISSTATGLFILRGEFTTSGLTSGDELYVNTTGGTVTATKPSSSGQMVRLVGYAVSATTLLVDPDKTYVEVS